VVYHRVMSAMLPVCPRCNRELEAVAPKGVEVLSCPKCHGTLLSDGQLPLVLEAMSAALAQAFSPDAKLEAVKNQGGSVACPVCKRAMSTDDYCGAKLVLFDRCEGCGHLWLDAEELGTMSLMWARMDARHQRDATTTAEMVAHAEGFTKAMLMRRYVGGFLFGRGVNYGFYSDY
jgi:Zn-finger nucleic acid-binding protein